LPEKLTDIGNNTVNSIPVNQGIPKPFDPWEQICSYALSFDGKSFFGDAAKLRVFAVNCLESYKEYGKVNSYTINELRSILYYFGKFYEQESHAPHGKELQFLHLLVQKITDLKDVEGAAS
jgi:hypothetical protein